MLSYRLVLMDIDGTAVDAGGFVSERLKKAAARLGENGIILCLATGRTFTGAKPVSNELKLQTPLIIQNGSVLLAEDHHTVLFSQSLTSSCVETVIERLPASVAAFVCDMSEGDHIYYNSRRALNELLARYPLQQHVFIYRARLEQCKQPVRMLLFGQTTELAVFSEAITTALASEIRAIHWNVPQIDMSVVELVPQNVSKAVAARKLARYLRIPREKVVALGDQHNDIELLNWAGLGIAMGDAPPEVIQVAQQTTLSSNEDGAAIALERFVLNEGRTA